LGQVQGKDRCHGEERGRLLYKGKSKLEDRFIRKKLNGGKNLGKKRDEWE